MIDFYMKHIAKIKKCENCGTSILHPGTKNVAHILPKSKFKSIATDDNNIMYLCTRLDRFDNNLGCHETFDKSWSSAKSMDIWNTAVQRVKRIRDKITETSKILFYFE